MSKKLTTLDIKAEMVRRGVTIARIARELGVTATWVSLVLHRKGKSERVWEAIAAAIEMDVKAIKPEDHRKAA